MANRYDYEREPEPGRERARGSGENFPRERHHDDDRWRARPGDERGLMDRAGDEVRSWFGDDEAARRRQRDETRDEREDWRRAGGHEDVERARGYRGGYGTERGYAAGEDVSRSSGYSPDRFRSREGWGRDWPRGERDWGQGRERFTSRQSRDDWSRDRHDWPESRREEFTPVGYSYTLFAWTEPGPFTGRGPRGYQRSDERIREDICDRLTRHGRLDATDITVTVRSGEVTLEGIVDTREAKRMAEDVAETVDGVRDVNNHLKTYRGGSDEISSRMTGSQPSTSMSNVSGPTNVPATGEKNR